MGKQFKLGAALLLATGTFTISLATPARAATCANGFLSTLAPIPFTCTTGGFSFTLNSYSGFSPNDNFFLGSFLSAGVPNFSFSASPATSWGTGTARVLNYTLTAPSGRLLSDYTSSLSGSAFGSNSGNFNLVGSAGNAQSTYVNGTGTSASKVYGTPLSSDTFTATLNTTIGSMTGFNTSYGADAVVPPVPGPLPILGATAAFGLSRKLRQRIKAAG